MVTIPDHLKKTHVLEVNISTELRIGWTGFDPSYSYARRRRIIKRRMAAMGFGVNTFEVKNNSLVDFNVSDRDSFESDAIVDGICFARAYYDGSGNTGVIKTNAPVVYDTVTGKCVTGISTGWKANEYTIVGTALADYNRTTAGGEDIPIKLSSAGGAALDPGTGILLYTEYRLPGRFLSGSDQIAGAFQAVKVRVEQVGFGIPGQFKLVKLNAPTDPLYTVVHPGRRDIRPHMYVFAQKLSEEDNPSNLYIVTSVYYE